MHSATIRKVKCRVWRDVVVDVAVVRLKVIVNVVSLRF